LLELGALRQRLALFLRLTQDRKEVPAAMILTPTRLRRIGRKLTTFGQAARHEHFTLFGARRAQVTVNARIALAVDIDNGIHGQAA